MSIKKVSAPTFSPSFLLPKYWLTWLGVLVLYLISWLPFRLSRWLGRQVGKLLAKLGKKRVAIARRNLQLCFPDWSEKKREAVVRENVQRAGIAALETAMGWWWPAWRVKRHIEIEGFEHVQKVLDSGKGVFGLALHNMNVEFACRALGYTHPSIAFYRKHNNPLMDYFQYHGRNRANKYMIHKRNSKALIEALDQGELCLYLPDQDYGAAQSIFVPFFAVDEAATTTATLMFARRADCVPLMVTSQYTPTGSRIKFYPPMDKFAELEDKQALTLLNKQIEQIILEQPESYLWMHKRFKSRPTESAPSLYD
ncbi:LpxL/LpxP family Kdo(2)-lipid IV(A) lauroyl/palmitoleoyl acyltransferase [Aestuariibacter salexigens]|uniref:LpxL/LpxP family Kdo(2)-lipid IV(A) lauroyl/palmitoleoyl acyltransferase n=1 Tax=Aestuariibacter salexigens TaxID=226010 RepID=UPI0004257E0A|nr:LpxL/LpxP family Kdo(2)-lipid IV(A) lauroyl/palmitoleoyl acyltransferase [Aestuariibacter salexigens]